MKEKEVLRNIGLTNSESVVYLALLELGDSTRGEIVNKSQIAGSKVYEILEKLQEKGLVSIYLQNKVKHFKPINPRQIMQYLEEQKQEISEVEKQAQDIFPRLLQLFNSQKKEQEVELLVGMKGMEIIFREQVELLQKGETCYVIGGTRGIDEGPTYSFFQKIHVLREEKGIKTRMLFNIRQRKHILQLYSSKKFPSTTSRFIHHTSPVAINIYRNRTVIIIFGATITAIHITSEEVAKSFLEYFNLLWEMSVA